MMIIMIQKQERTKSLRLFMNALIGLCGIFHKLNKNKNKNRNRNKNKNKNKNKNTNKNKNKIKNKIKKYEYSCKRN